MIEMLRQHADKFWSRVIKRDDSECWLWMTALDRSGYGRFQFRHNGQKKSIKAHRVSYMLTHNHGINSDKFICHTCDNPRCVNPIHLMLGNNDINMADCVSKGRQAKGSGHPNSKLTEVQIIEIRQKLANGQQKASIAREFGVCKSTLTYISQKRTWRHVV